jgi:nucleoid-associated protein YgaU
VRRIIAAAGLLLTPVIAKVVYDGVARNVGQETPLLEREYTVKPGDTLWGIVEELDPGEDPRPIVDAMLEARHGAPLIPGEIVKGPGLSFTAEEGDTPWKVAKHIVGEDGNPRPLSDAINAAAGPDGLKPGESITIAAEDL